MEIIAKFDGGDAESHLLPAFEGSQSIEGIARTITLVAHYMVTGEVRKRYPFDNTARLYLAPPRAGSFESLFSLLTDPNTRLVTTASGVLAIGVASNMIVELLKLVAKRAVGQDHTPNMQEVTRLVAQRPGEIEALGEAVEPSLKKAHTVISNGAGQVVIISGSNNIIRLDERTKSYILTTERDHDVRQLLVSVGMLNANTRNGRVYNHELKRTVPFHVINDANPRTLPNLAQSLQRYSSRYTQSIRSEIVIVFTTERSIDGVEKKYIVQDAFFIES